MKKIHIYFTIILLSLFTGCKKDFLDVEPISLINSNSFYATKSDADQAITAIYGMLNYTQLWDYSIFADFGSVASDDAQAGGNNFEDVPDWQQVDRFTFNQTLSGIRQPYGLLYKAVMFANLAIENLPNIPKKDTSAGLDFINQRVGEAKFLRALNTFYLAQIYGEIPLVDHVLGQDEFYKGRSALIDIYGLIEKDLQDAIAILPAKYSNASDLGRATKGAAQGLLAKVYLFMSSYAHYYPNDNYSAVNPGKSRFEGLTERWSDALSMAEAVINSGNYDLPGINGETYKTWRGDNTDGFRYIWTTEGDNSKESVFEIQCGYYGLGWLLTRGSAVVWWTSARWVYDPSTNAPVSANYWGFNIPSVDLVEEFNKEQRHPGDPYIALQTPADPRFNTTIHKDTIGGNDSIHIYFGTLDSSLWCKICYTFSATQFNPTKMYQAKYECSGDEFVGQGGGWGEAPLNIRVLRYADVVLIAAEAAIMLGDNTKAQKYLNMVRTRARMCGPAGNTVPADYAAGYTVTMDDLMHDRRLELAMEGHRFYDLVRWNKATEKLSNGPLTGLTITSNFQSPKNDFYPIPQSEVNIVNTNGGKIEQYPGW